MKTPSIWMEARCATVASITSENWVAMAVEDCHQTVLDGGFFSDVRRARRHFERQGWKVIDGEWWCPCCAAKLAG